MAMIRVFARPPLKVARISADGRPLPAGNAVGWLPGENGKLVPVEEGVVVEDHPHYRRAAARGECRVEEVSS